MNRLVLPKPFGLSGSMVEPSVHAVQEWFDSQSSLMHELDRNTLRSTIESVRSVGLVFKTLTITNSS